MTKKELQAELIRWIKGCEVAMYECDDEESHERAYCEGRIGGLKLALQYVEHLDEVKA